MFEIITQFENRIAKFYGSRYAVSTDCCTHAIELCLRYQPTKTVSCPTHTYLSVPMTFQKLNIDWCWNDQEWHDLYYIGNTNIVDAAVYWQPGGYIKESLMCLSFQYQKHLNLIRGGAILTDSEQAYIDLKKLSFDGRIGDQPWRDQTVTSIGYHYYMPIETAKLGLEKIDAAIASKPRRWSWQDYPFLPNMPVFHDHV
jgi:dTDP-4-amino-4,6-dideoxygalactose transaminase